MSEGGLGSKLENFRNKIPFLRKRNSPPPITTQHPQPEPEPEQQAVTAEKITPATVVPEIAQTPSYRSQAIRDILGTISLQTKKGLTDIEIREILRANPYLESVEPEKMQEFLNNHLPKNDEERSAILNNQGAIDFLTQAIPENPNSASKKLHKKWLYKNLIQPNSANSANDPIEKVIEQVQHGENQTTDSGEPRSRRPIIIEKDESSMPIESEEALREYVTRKVKSEIPAEEILEVIDYLSTEDVNLLNERYRKKAYGEFEGYSVVPRGKSGRILFRVDAEGKLHVRLGMHDKIYLQTTKVS